MTEFLAAASGHYKFDCLCTNWYGGYGAATLEADQALIEQQIGELVTLADQYGIEDIVLAEMQRPNPDQEVRSSLPLTP